MPFYDMALDAGYRGEEARAMARQIEEDEQRRHLQTQDEARAAQPDDEQRIRERLGLGPGDDLPF